MSNKNNHPDSPVIETTVVKASDAKTTDTAKAATEEASKPTVFDTAVKSDATDAKKTDTKAVEPKATSTKKETPAKVSETTATKDDNVSKENTAQNSSEKKEVTKKPEAAPAKKTNTTAKKASTTKPSSGQHRVAILGGNRIPFARSNGSYADVSNTDMLTAALDGLIERFNLQDEKVGEVVAGAVMKLSRDINLTREATLNTALNPHTPTYDISQACGTGLQATFASANKIALGIIDSAITGGVDTTSDAPIAVGDGLRKV